MSFLKDFILTTKSTHLLLRVSLLVSVVAFLAIPLKGTSQGNLLLTPKRIVFEGSKRSEELNIVNTGKDTARYVISFVQIRMKEDGSFETITVPDSAQFFADKNLRFFPRSVTLAPNEAQTVKVQLTNKGKLEPGEYRSHLYLRSVSTNQPLGETDTSKAATGISIKIVPVFGFSIPMIIRIGENTAGADFSRISVTMEKDTLPYVNIDLNRTGNMSVYGDIWVDHTSPEGKVTRVGLIKGLSVYTPNTKRYVRVALNKDIGIDYHSGKLHIVYAYQAAKVERVSQQEIKLY